MRYADKTAVSSTRKLRFLRCYERAGWGYDHGRLLYGRVTEGYDHARVVYERRHGCYDYLTAMYERTPQISFILTRPTSKRGYSPTLDQSNN